MRGALGPLCAVASALALGVGCASPVEAPFRHQREDYEAFRSLHREVVDPNYLPFMVTEVPARPQGWLARRMRQASEALSLPTTPLPRRLVFCRWPRAAFPLPVHIQVPKVSDISEDELRPFLPERYAAAVKSALHIWQRDLDEQVSFRLVDRAEDAILHVRLLAHPGPQPQPDMQVLGVAQLGNSCQTKGGDPAQQLDVRFRVSELRLYIVDEYGLLLPNQVEKVALHELGHALGMRGHSPIPADLMFPAARDRLGPDGLGESDVNSFLALYALPNGTVYADPARTPPERPDALLPEGPPRLDGAPHVDVSRGFEVQVPRGWSRVQTPFGLVAVNGVAWDYEASLQVHAYPADSIDNYLERYGAAHLQDSRVLATRRGTISGHEMRQFLLQTRRGTREQFAFVEIGNHRVVVMIGECPTELHHRYGPWFDAVLATLSVRDAITRDRDHDYQ